MANVESVSSSVVREYLSRKGLKDTLAMLDKEMPRTHNCIGNRAQLAKELHINTLMKKNKESQSAFRTMLEVIVQFMMNKTWQKHSVASLIEPEKTLDTSREIHPPERVESYQKININADHDTKQTENDPRKPKNEIAKTKRKVSPSKEGLKSHLENQRGKQIAISASLDDKSGLDKIIKGSDKDLSVHNGRSSRMFSISKVTSESGQPVSTDEMDLKTSSVQKQIKPETKTAKELPEGTFQDKNIFGNYQDIKKRTSSNNTPSMKSSSLKKSSRRQISNVSGSFMGTGQGKDERTRYIKERVWEKPKYFVEDVKEIKDDQSWRNPRTSSSADKNFKINEELFSGKDDRKRYVKEDFRERPKYYVDDVKENQDFLVRGSRETLHSDETLMRIQEPFSVNKREQNMVSDWKKEVMQEKESRKNPPSSQLKTKNVASSEELIFEDIDDNFEDELDKLYLSTSPKRSSKSLLQSHPITFKQAKALKALVFGSALGCFNTEWRNQGFSFCQLDHLTYGIIQHKGGPCGLLASVQAVVLKQLLFKDRLSTSGITKQRLHFSSQETSDVLCSALVEILWRAGSFKTARVALRCEKDQFIPSGGYKVDRLTEKLVIYETNDCNELEKFMKENIGQFSSDDGGCILLLYSVVLTRGVATIKEDMDDENGTLMGAHGYCTQDMVNLLVTGKAISNTFDDVIELDSGGETKNILKGIDKQSDIGLLSLFEHYKSCLVGSNLKCPKYPIWVVCSESHFSVLFSMKRSLVNERRSQKVFDLYYYDGLAGQTEEIRLTIDTSSERMVQDTPDDLTPPLEHCIRTKWKEAVIDWNGTEPLL